MGDSSETTPEAKPVADHLEPIVGPEFVADPDLAVDPLSPTEEHLVDIHKPKPVHSWRELGSEIGVIVIGILIALVLEQSVEILRERKVAAEARYAVRAEVQNNLAEMQVRLATQQCIEKRLDEIGDLLSRTQDGPLNPQPQWVGQPAIIFMASQRWQAATGSGRISLFEPDEQGRYATVYGQTAEFSVQEEQEQLAWAQLRGLEGWRGPLGAPGKIHFLQALQQARYTLWSTKVTLEVALDAGKAVGIAPHRATDINSLPHSICLPIGTPRAEALAKLTDQDYGQPK